MLTPLGSSPALSTLASHARQVGRHEEAAGLDARALELATSAEDLADATSGLVADAVGVGDAGTALARLPAAYDAAGQAGGWRARTRLGWVRAELGLLAGDGSAVAAAEEAFDAASGAAAPRHVVKSLLVRGVARLESDAPTAALTDLLLTLDAAPRQGLVPLVWPAALVAARVLPARAAALRATGAAAAAAVVAGLGAAGAAFAARPEIASLLAEARA